MAGMSGYDRRQTTDRHSLLSLRTFDLCYLLRKYNYFNFSKSCFSHRGLHLYDNQLAKLIILNFCSFMSNRASVGF